MAHRRNWTQIEIDHLKQLATESRMSTYDLGNALDRDPETVRKCMVKHGITRLSRGRAMELNYFWTGGRKIDKGGYVLVKCPGHPHLNSDGYIREHRLVMELVIGRYLLPEEVVHHKDENHQNNTPDNLKLYETNGEHLKDELTGKVPEWTADGRANILRAIQHRHESVLLKPPRPEFDRSAWAKGRQRNTSGEFDYQIPTNNGQE